MRQCLSNHQTHSLKPLTHGRMTWALLLCFFCICLHPWILKAQDKIELQKLEEDFWAAKDTDFKVIQNRAFPKEKRFFANLSSGVLVNDPFTSATIYRGALGYYFSERWGLELGVEGYQSVDNRATKYFKSSPNIYPNYNFLRNYQYVSLAWVPFYAKMSFIDRKILYFDIQFNLGFGRKEYEAFQQSGAHLGESTFAYHLDVVQNIFFTRNWSFRLDIRNHWSYQNIYYSNNGTKESRNLINDTTILLGLNYFL